MIRRPPTSAPVVELGRLAGCAGVIILIAGSSRENALGLTCDRLDSDKLSDGLTVETNGHHLAHRPFLFVKRMCDASASLADGSNFVRTLMCSLAHSRLKGIAGESN